MGARTGVAGLGGSGRYRRGIASKPFAWGDHRAGDGDRDREGPGSWHLLQQAVTLSPYGIERKPLKRSPAEGHNCSKNSKDRPLPATISLVAAPADPARDRLPFGVRLRGPVFASRVE